MKIAIVGGGAAGLMTAATIREMNPEAEVFLIEKNARLGKKVIISGGGRCNVTTGLRDIKTVLTKYPRGGKFLSSAMHTFSPEHVYDWFESLGVPLKIEEDMRVFPKSDDGHDVVRVFENMFQDSNVHVMLDMQAERIEKQTDEYAIYFQHQAAPLLVDKLVLTTGGQAYRQTGSTGDGYAFAMGLGHTITKLAPSLNAFFAQEIWTAEISGLSFTKAKITAKREKNPSAIGPLLFTHKGVSGPAVFALSSLVAFEAYDPKTPMEISIDLFPDLSTDELRASIEGKINTHIKKSFTNILTVLIPKSLAEVICRELSLLGEKHAIEIGMKDILRVVAWLKAIPLHIVGRGAGDEFVTAGGVDLKEVNPSTMESKISPGLYFAGEILDIDGYTGGFNLQASWATGHLAGMSAGSNPL